jgi:hypothetical protein
MLTGPCLHLDGWNSLESHNGDEKSALATFVLRDHSPLVNCARKSLVHAPPQLMAHSLDATVAQVDVVGTLGNHGAFNLNDATKTLRDRPRADGSRVVAGLAWGEHKQISRRRLA